jgi:aspartyl-tRNA(Asn)/glutamyl-tRNA(Gln) amidotransferase subunit C
MPHVLSAEEVEHIAELAKLGLTEREKCVFREQLSAILEHFERLQQLDTSAISPTFNVLPLHTVMREDKVQPSLSPEELLANAPDSDGDSFRVDAILD